MQNEKDIFHDGEAPRFPDDFVAQPEVRSHEDHISDVPMFDGTAAGLEVGESDVEGDVSHETLYESDLHEAEIVEDLESTYGVFEGWNITAKKRAFMQMLGSKLGDVGYVARTLVVAGAAAVTPMKAASADWGQVFNQAAQTAVQIESQKMQSRNQEASMIRQIEQQAMMQVRQIDMQIMQVEQNRNMSPEVKQSMITSLENQKIMMIENAQSQIASIREASKATRNTMNDATRSRIIQGVLGGILSR